MVSERRQCWGLFRQRQCLLPTTRGWLLLLVVGFLSIAIIIRNIHSFLAVTRPVDGSILVVEGWGPDYAMEEARTEFLRHSYERLFVTGGQFEKGSAFAAFRSHAELSAAVLVRLGMNTNAVQAVPAMDARRDRTFASARTLKVWLQTHGGVPAKLNVMSLGVHSRRTRLLFEKAFGNETKIGIISVENRDYDPQHWWRKSQGFRIVTDEVIAYLYARFIFTPPLE